MNGYKVFYDRRTAEIYANTTLEARDAAAIKFKVPKSKLHMISVVFCERADGSVVTHSIAEL